MKMKKKRKLSASQNNNVFDVPHKICTAMEYFFLYRPKGKHSVCFDYDEVGNVAIWYLATNGEYETNHC
jgi:hypothetical protein